MGYDSAPGYFRIRQQLGGIYDLGEIYVSNSAALQRDSLRNYLVGIVADWQEICLRVYNDNPHFIFTSGYSLVCVGPGCKVTRQVFL